MKLSASEQESLVALLTRIYLDIRDIEEEFQLLIGEHDFRPRIEYFHDAIRAFTSQSPGDRDLDERLSVELLAYDLNCLRFIQSSPMSPFKAHGHVLSPSTGMVPVTPSLTVKAKRPDRATRERLVELYQHYTVLFAALLKPLADMGFKARSDDLDQDVRDLHAISHNLEALSKGKDALSSLSTAALHLEEEELRQLLQQFIQQQKYKNKDAVKKLLQFLKQRVAKKDKAIAAIESAHMNYVLSQLAIFEGSKDMLKKMAAQGMNLVGKFVESAMAEARRSMGGKGR